MAKIDLEFPYTEKYKAGYVRVNSCEKEAVDFNPTSQYGIEKDDHEFVLNDIKLIHDLTKNSISKDKRREFQKQFRLKCFDYLKV